MTDEKPPIVLIHGFWMTPKSWNTWADRFRAEGHQVIVPGWPGIDDRSVEDIREHPEPLEGHRGSPRSRTTTSGSSSALPREADHHGALLRRRHHRRCSPTAAVGVGLRRRRTRTDRGRHDPARCRRCGPARADPLATPSARTARSRSRSRHFHFTFGNDLPREESDELWEEFAVNSYNRVFFEGVALGAQREGRSDARRLRPRRPRTAAHHHRRDRPRRAAGHRRGHREEVHRDRAAPPSSSTPRVPRRHVRRGAAERERPGVPRNSGPFGRAAVVLTSSTWSRRAARHGGPCHGSGHARCRTS